MKSALVESGTEGDDLLPTRRTLLSRLRDAGDQESWHEFFETYWRLIYRAAIHGGLHHAEAEDVVQETVLTVCRRIGQFRYDPAKGSFKGWLLQTTKWRIQDAWRSRPVWFGNPARRAHEVD